uniref:Tudor domain containing 6 n=1 Tax=Latimeria chalumnae TaxID=7897 RepID=H3ARN7_LATCH
MCSTPGVPTPGALLNLRVSWVELHPDLVLVRVWGFDRQREGDYQRLQREIQTAAKSRFGSGGRSPSVGDLCLVELNETWHRCRIVGRTGDDFQVFFLDRGCTLPADALSLAQGRDSFFHLPPEVIGCFLANLVPLCLEAEVQQCQWSPRAVEFFRYLHGREVEGLVQDVILPQRGVLLEVPSVTKQMCEMGLAKQISKDAFKGIVERSFSSQYRNVLHGSLFFQNTRREMPEPRVVPGQGGGYTLDYFYPLLQVGVIESVIVTHVIDPHRVFCQLRSLSQEVKRLSEHMYQFYERRHGLDETWPEKLGSPCAAKGNDFRWHRAVVHQVFSSIHTVEVLYVDYGRKEFVPKSNIRYLIPEYFRMPVVTYSCALFGTSEGGSGWSTSQIEKLKSLILNKDFNAKIEYHSSFEHTYYVTFHGDCGENVNFLFGSQNQCFSENMIDCYKKANGHNREVQKNKISPCEGDQVQRKNIDSGLKPPWTGLIKTAELKVNTFYDAVVEFVKDPSEFWIRTKEFAVPFSKMMASITETYTKANKLDGIVRKPEPGLFCCAKFKDDCYYRAIVLHVQGKLVEVFFVDTGNTEMVDWYDVKVLLSKYKTLPAVALKCSLVDIGPICEKWTREAIVCFKRAVIDKELVIHVLAKQEDRYIIEMLESGTGETSISKVIFEAGYAKYQEFQTVKTALKGTLVNPVQEQVYVKQSLHDQANIRPFSHITLSSDHRPAALSGSPSQMPVECQQKTTVDLSSTENQLLLKLPNPYESQVFEVGSTVDVHVSFIDSPGDFWCQLLKGAQELESLMEQIQEHYKNNVEPYQRGNPACIAKYSEDNKWYRALIVREVIPSAEFLVLYVDYGNKERVQIKDLQAIKPEFVRLKAQAFRCSLYNLIHPIDQDPFVWNEDSFFAFQEFVDGAVAGCVELKCTVYAWVAVADKGLFNVVDLSTPFQSICHLLVGKGLAKLLGPLRALVPSVHLYTYYYSTHDIKIGSEEQVYVTYVINPGTFYCQLARNSGVLDQLAGKISILSTKIQPHKCAVNPGTLCLAKYSDQHWYRGKVISLKSKIEVFFVDYGNTQIVEKEDLLPIPNEAQELLFLPMQAIKCKLSDVPAKVPEEISDWFETAVLDTPLQALVVAKETDGRLIVELYDGNTQINAKITERLGLHSSKDSKQLLQDETFSAKQPLKNESWNTKNVKCKPQNKGRPGAVSYVQKTTGDGLFKCDKDRIGNQKETELPLRSSSKKVKQRSVNQESQKVQDGWRVNTDAAASTSEKVKLDQLPEKQLTPGLKTQVYISHINSPSCFFVQLAKDESELLILAEKLNAGGLITESINKEALQVGNLVCAEFPDDGCAYRAVVKEKYPNGMVHVEFIDYGNTTTVDACKLLKLEQEFLSIPKLSIMCSLNRIQSSGSLGDWTEEVVVFFRKRTGESEVTCEFIHQLGLSWEVDLSDQQGSVADDLVNCGYAVINNMQSLTAASHNAACSPQLMWNIPVEKTCQAYAIAVDGPDYFWCQFANSDGIEYLTEKTEEVGRLAKVNENFATSVQCGDACILKYKKDNRWYRAIIKGINDNLLSIRFVDYGNEDEVSREQIRPISSELLKIPVQAFPCSLAGFEFSTGFWDDSASEKFYEIVTEDVLTVTVIRFGKDEVTCGVPLAYVKIESKGMTINAVMKPFWKS